MGGEGVGKIPNMPVRILVGEMLEPTRSPFKALPKDTSNLQYFGLNS